MQSDSSTSSSEPKRSARDSLTFGLRALVGVLVSAIVWTACTALFLRGETDEAYLRIASPAQSSLIVGTSRAAQGLYPKAFPTDSRGFAGPMYNFAFTSATSPWGPAYLRAIEMKLARMESRPGLFVLEVSPLAFTVNPKDGLRENKSFLAKLHSVTLSPNPEYPFYQSERGVDILEGLLQSALDKVRKRLHPDGWLEISLEDRSSRFEARLEQKLAQNQKSFESTVESTIRWEFFQRTIDLLATRGHVCLVRLPVHPRMLELERTEYPEFETKIAAIAEAKGVPFVDLTAMGATVSTTDGSHLAKESAPIVTRELVRRLPADWVD